MIANLKLGSLHLSKSGDILNSHHNSPSSDYNFGLEPTNYSLETIGYIEDRKFSSMPQRGDTYSVNVNYQDKDLLGSEKACLESLKTGVNGECSVSIGDLKRKVCLTSKQLRSCSNNGGITISSTKCSQHRRLGPPWNLALDGKR